MFHTSQLPWPRTLRAAALSLAALAAAAPSQAALQGRNLDGNAATFEAYYDTVLDITWYADLQAFSGSVLQVTSAVDAFSIGGFSDWRLPVVVPLNPSGALNFLFTNNGSSESGTAKSGIGWGLNNEMGHLYYVTLGNQGFYLPDDANPNGFIVNPLWNPNALNYGPFNPVWPQGNITNYIAQPAGLSNDTLYFFFNLGLQGGSEGTVRGMAVRDGDTVMAAIPEPSSYAMMVLGLLAVGGAVRRRMAASV